MDAQSKPMKDDWVSVASGIVPERLPDEEPDELISRTLLLYVPIWSIRGRDAVVPGNYLYWSKKFRPAGSHGWEDYVTHWREVPAPPAGKKR